MCDNLVDIKLIKYRIRILFVDESSCYGIGMT